VKRPADGGKIHVDLPEETNTWALDFSKLEIIELANQF
jgi:hypothetical protein